MEGATRESGLKTTWTDMGSIGGLMEECLKGSTETIESTGMASIGGKMEGDMRVIGLQANNMALESISRVTATILQNMVFGRLVKG